MRSLTKIYGCVWRIRQFESVPTEYAWNPSCSLISQTQFSLQLVTSMLERVCTCTNALSVFPRYTSIRHMRGETDSCCLNGPFLMRAAIGFVLTGYFWTRVLQTFLWILSSGFCRHILYLSLHNNLPKSEKQGFWPNKGYNHALTHILPTSN